MASELVLPDIVSWYTTKDRSDAGRSRNYDLPSRISSALTPEPELTKDVFADGDHHSDAFGTPGRCPDCLIGERTESIVYSSNLSEIQPELAGSVAMLP